VDPERVEAAAVERLAEAVRERRPEAEDGLDALGRAAVEARQELRAEKSVAKKAVRSMSGCAATMRSSGAWYWIGWVTR
jgi:hypothetical protein